jgi:parvulin-like peptidyl-prolyl isomerase
VALAAITGGLSVGVTGLAAATFSNFASSIAKKVALNAVTHGLGNAVKVQELGHLGHGVFEHLLGAVTAAEKAQAQGDDQDLLAAYVTKLVQDELKNIDPDMLAEAIEEAAKSTKESSDQEWDDHDYDE